MTCRPRSAEHREELAGAVADGLLERVVQPAPLALAADHRRRKAPAFPAGCLDRSAGRLVEADLTRTAVPCEAGCRPEWLARRSHPERGRNSPSHDGSCAHAESDLQLVGRLC